MSDITRPFSGKRYFERSEALDPCVCCGKAVRRDRPFSQVLVLDGGARFALASEDVDHDDNGNMGCFAIGSDCLRQLRKELPDVYVERKKAE